MKRIGSAHSPSRFVQSGIGIAVLSVMALAMGVLTPQEVRSEETHLKRLRRTTAHTDRVRRSLPEPYAQVRVNGEPHYLADGRFFVEVRRGHSTFYAPVEPEYGARMEGMPTEWRVLMIHGQTYYRNGPHFFKRINRNGEAAFELQKPPIGAEIANVPATYQLLTDGSMIYYSADGVYYLRVENDEGARYQVVSGPS